MKPTAYVCLVAFANTDILIQTVQSMVDSAIEYRIHLCLFSHTTNSDVLDACLKCREIVKIAGHQVDYHPCRINRGLSRTWNEFIRIYADHPFHDDSDAWLIVNDDIKFSGNSLDILCNLSVANRDKYAINPNGDGYSCQALNPILWKTCGYFDENIFPAYYEDSEMSYRCQLAGLEQMVCPNIGIEHLGSQTTKRHPEIQEMCDIWVPKNCAYFMRKWGGGPCEEKYVVPFDAYELDKPLPRFGYYLPFDQPYYGVPYDRIDYEEFITNYA